MTNINIDMDIEELRMCLLCMEDVTYKDEKAEGHWFDEQGRKRLVHRECALRNVIGGIGHLTDHYLWCTINSDPDGGRTYRQSAIEVDQWIRRNGFPR